MLVFHSKERERKKKFGKLNKDKTFYVIRPTNTVSGILAIYLKVIKEINLCNRQGYIPVVDLKNYNSQFAELTADDSINPWVLYFDQVSPYSLDEVYQSKNVIISGWNASDFFCKDKIKGMFDCDEFSEIIDLYSINPAVQVSQRIMKMSRGYIDEYIHTDTLGVFVRGTDFIASSPKNHFIQPSPMQLTEKIKEFIYKYDIGSIFVVTEDNKIFQELQNNIQIAVTGITQHEFENFSYDKNFYLCEYIDGKDVKNISDIYLIKCVCLSRCPYVIGSISSGSVFAGIIRETACIDSYYFNIGRY